jgi:glucokinase
MFVIAVDIGATNLLVGITENGRVVHRTHEPIQAHGDFEVVASQVCRAILDSTDTKIDAVGISVAGSVSADDGIVIRAENLDWNNAPLATFVSEQLACNVVIENDVTAAAWGEFTFGAGTECDSMFAVWVGTGIGGGLILNNKIWRGPLGTGGEFGMGISEFNPDSTHRVLEAFASRSGLQQLLENPTLNTESIASQYGIDPVLTQFVDVGAKRIGTGIANVITLLSIDTVVLGGGLVEALGDPFINSIRAQFEQDVFPPHCKQCEFKTTQLGPDAGLLGVAALVE